MENKIFALDIGTRMVRGLLVELLSTPASLREAGRASYSPVPELRIIDCEILEHETRAMFAGQIHDIDKVAKIVRRIKKTLEERNGLELQRVAVAVAGRMLRTFREKTKKTVSLEEELTAKEIRDLELSAVQEIINRLNKENIEFYCVGYSVVNYWLDGVKINNLIGQKGEQIEVEILATFLPRKVLESIFTVLKKVDLEILSVTLEPIAAINAIIPPDMRRLNLSLVDIGAGTSDIAITRGGSVIAYGMVPSAGDEITEKLCESYLLDFTVGEQVKRRLSSEEKISFTDIFAREHEVSSQEIVKEIMPAVENLTKKIAQEILTLNQVAPQAIVCVGGGSHTPYLKEKLAEVLSLSKERVGIRKTEMVKFLDDKTGKLSGPEGVTPVGIALLAAEGQGLEFVNLAVNGKKVRLLNLNRNFTVFSALVGAGDLKKIYPRPGLAKTFEINGEMRIVKGTFGKPAVIKLKGEIVGLDTMVSDNDEIIFNEAVDGEDAKVKLIDLVNDSESKKIILNGREIKVRPLVLVNGCPVEDWEMEVPDRAKIAVQSVFLLKDILTKEGYPTGLSPTSGIYFFVNGEKKNFKWKNYHLTVNGKEEAFDYVIDNGDVIEYQVFPEISYRVKDVVELPREGDSLRVKVNGEEYVFPGGRGKILLNGREVGPEEPVFEGAIIETYPGKNAEVILVDIFRYISLGLENERVSTKQNGFPLNKKLKLLINNEEAKFTSPLSDGSEVKIYFE